MGQTIKSYRFRKKYSQPVPPWPLKKTSKTRKTLDRNLLVVYQIIKSGVKFYFEHFLNELI